MSKYTYQTPTTTQKLFAVLLAVAEKLNIRTNTQKRTTAQTGTATNQQRKTAFSNKTREHTVAVIGLGYVGLPLALAADKKGMYVVGIDVNPSLVERITAFNAPESVSTDEAHAFSKHTIHASTDSSSVREAGTVLICVPTPVHKNHAPDLRPVLNAVKDIAPHIQPGTLVIVESTVSPGVNENIVLPALERGSGLEREETLYFAHCPERINPGDPRWNVGNIPRVVGGIGPESLERATSFYLHILQAKIRQMTSIREAEAVKMVENSFRDVNIAFVNELAMSFQKLGIDVSNVIDGAATKPFGFMPHYPGCGVGGHCIPVDPYYLIAEAEKNGFNHRFLKVARDVNNNMPAYTVQLLKQALRRKGKKVKGSRVALLGLAYKKEVADTRESPALKIRALLTTQGAHVQAYDPYISDLSNTKTLSQALTGADAVLLATDHPAFDAISPELLQLHEIDVVVDGRNFFEKNAFLNADIDYVGIGQ